MVMTDTKYKPLPTDSDSNDDNLEGNLQDVSLCREKQRRHRPWFTWQTAAIAVLALGWLATIIAWHQAWTHSGPFRMYTNTPIPSDVFKPVRKVFDKDERYMGGTREADVAWDGLVAGHDAVWIENPEQWGLGEGIVAPYDHPNTPTPKPQNFYVISILHQLHCLNMIRFQYYQEKNNVKSTNGESAETSFKWKVHVEHCFEYLRQGISCGGDLIIEGNSPIKVGKGHATSVTGWGVEHDCIDFDLLRSFQIEQEAKYNLTWQDPQIQVDSADRR